MWEGRNISIYLPLAITKRQHAPIKEMHEVILIVDI
jgi:hypothetical protein